MIDFLKQILSDGQDNYSALRVMSFISLTIGSIIALVGLYKSSDLSQVAQLSAVFVVAAFGAKVGQKYVE